MSVFPIAEVRRSFPALKRAAGHIFFDNAAGAQAPKQVLDAVREHLLVRNVQRGGAYKQSREVDDAIDRARKSVALLVNARAPEEICFGMNATSFIRLVSVAIGQLLGRSERREIIVTDLDHESNIATWLALENAKIVWWRMRDDGQLHPEDLNPLLSQRTQVVACTLASNCMGSILDVAEVSKRAHAVGAQVFVDAVHYGPHAPIDVRAFDCDYMACSGYKIFAPHMGFLWGRKELLDALPTFREDFIPDVAPAKFEVGTYVYENVAGMDAAVRYLEALGARISPARKNRRAAIVAAMKAIREYETLLSLAFLDAMKNIDGVKVYGLTDPAHVSHRTPTFSFNLDALAPSEVARRLAAKNIGVRDGNMYAPRVMNRLELKDRGAVRASLVHYNTVEEIARFSQELASLSRGRSASASRARAAALPRK